MGAKAKLGLLRASPQKVRLVVDLVRGKKLEEALNILAFSKKSCARPIRKLIKSAEANATEAGDYDVDRLYIKKIMVDAGPSLKRMNMRAMGRADIIRCRTSKIFVELDEKE